LSANLIDEIAAKAARLPVESQRQVLRIVESMAASQSGTDPYLLPPLVTDEAERGRLLRELVEEMKSHPITGNPPRLTREELHERR
jgi:hypothetical protein